MSKLILLIVAAAWMAVLLPPLVRSRLDMGATSSVSDFRRQLSTLQRTQAPRAQAPMRAMTRPLAPGPRRGPAPVAHRGRPAPAPRGPRLVASEGMLEPDMAPTRARRADHLPRRHATAATAPLSQREIVRRRRVNILYGLLAANGVTLFLAFTTGSSAMVYAFSAVFLGLAAYCYVLVQIRNQEYLRRHYRGHRAA